MTGGVQESIADSLDLAVADQDCRCTTWRLSGTVEQAPRVHYDYSIRCGVRSAGGSCESQRQNTQAE
ncbi:MAG TPA: hypothetical protein VFS58_07150 [Steroidobacteraceae bacterium]|nr:hypothetical protein [Steroidobacteraceae bacterium]